MQPIYPLRSSTPSWLSMTGCGPAPFINFWMTPLQGFQSLLFGEWFEPRELKWRSASLTRPPWFHGSRRRVLHIWGKGTQEVPHV